MARSVRNTVAEDVRGRLDRLSRQYPSWISLAVDQAGHDRLMNAVGLCRGTVLLTDNGGGDLSKIHVRTVLGAVGYAAVIVWFRNPRDAAVVRAACLDGTAATASPRSVGTPSHHRA